MRQARRLRPRRAVAAAQFQVLDPLLELHQCRHPQQRLFQSGHVVGGATGLAGQQRKCPHGADEFGGVPVGQRSDASRDVAEEIDVFPGDTETDDGSENIGRAQR